MIDWNDRYDQESDAVTKQFLIAFYVAVYHLFKNDTNQKNVKIEKSKMGFGIGFRRFYAIPALPSHRGDLSAYFKLGEIWKRW